MSETIVTVGRRKEAVARVRLVKGKGSVIINNKDYKTYFPQPVLQHNVELPFKTLKVENQYDVRVKVEGGGVRGQSDAVRLGIARALCQLNGEYRPLLKPLHLLTRDPRRVERKKYGLKKARKHSQYSKR